MCCTGGKRRAQELDVLDKYKVQNKDISVGMAYQIVMQLLPEELKNGKSPRIDRSLASP